MYIRFDEDSDDGSVGVFPADPDDKYYNHSTDELKFDMNRLWDDQMAIDKTKKFAMAIYEDQDAPDNQDAQDFIASEMKQFLRDNGECALGIGKFAWAWQDVSYYCPGAIALHHNTGNRYPHWTLRETVFQFVLDNMSQRTISFTYEMLAQYRRTQRESRKELIQYSTLAIIFGNMVARDPKSGRVQLTESQRRLLESGDVVSFQQEDTVAFHRRPHVFKKNKRIAMVSDIFEQEIPEKWGGNNMDCWMAPKDHPSTARLLTALLAIRLLPFMDFRVLIPVIFTIKVMQYSPTAPESNNNKDVEEVTRSKFYQCIKAAYYTNRRRKEGPHLYDFTLAAEEAMLVLKCNASVLQKFPKDDHNESLFNIRATTTVQANTGSTSSRSTLDTTGSSSDNCDQPSSNEPNEITDSSKDSHGMDGTTSCGDAKDICGSGSLTMSDTDDSNYVYMECNNDDTVKTIVENSNDNGIGSTLGHSNSKDDNQTETHMDSTSTGSSSPHQANSKVSRDSISKSHEVMDSIASKGSTPHQANSMDSNMKDNIQTNLHTTAIAVETKSHECTDAITSKGSNPHQANSMDSNMKDNSQTNLHTTAIVVASKSHECTDATTSKGSNPDQASSTDSAESSNGIVASVHQHDAPITIVPQSSGEKNDSDTNHHTAATVVTPKSNEVRQPHSTHPSSHSPQAIHKSCCSSDFSPNSSKDNQTNITASPHTTTAEVANQDYDGNKACIASNQASKDKGSGSTDTFSGSVANSSTPSGNICKGESNKDHIPTTDRIDVTASTTNMESLHDKNGTSRSIVPSTGSNTHNDTSNDTAKENGSGSDSTNTNTNTNTNINDTATATATAYISSKDDCQIDKLTTTEVANQNYDGNKACTASNETSKDNGFGSTDSVKGLTNNTSTASDNNICKGESNIDHNPTTDKLDVTVSTANMESRHNEYGTSSSIAHHEASNDTAKDNGSGSTDTISGSVTIPSTPSDNSCKAESNKDHSPTDKLDVTTTAMENHHNKDGTVKSINSTGSHAHTHQSAVGKKRKAELSVRKGSEKKAKKRKEKQSNKENRPATTIVKQGFKSGGKTSVPTKAEKRKSKKDKRRSERRKRAQNMRDPST
ncbi:expressed unknown protein [Seminavis robusta]|uniref:Uncharacterized protein n=1 Tax=Seminavis robusta TaxID=568900 RepID=A0A9N8DVH9_9STRA|nr:expressed unknown protein [Seminavis robusta]|eukprot:Sro403_g135610.1 n/a (1108) ;mRNA; f:17019-20342